jgi:hypothetical protein
VATRRSKTTWCPESEVLLQPAGAASPLTALLLAHIRPVFSVAAPCQPGASPPSVRQSAEPDQAENRITVHLHGGFVPWTSDGRPFTWFALDGSHGPSFMNPGAAPPRTAAAWAGGAGRDISLPRLCVDLLAVAAQALDHGLIAYVVVARGSRPDASRIPTMALPAGRARLVRDRR